MIPPFCAGCGGEPVATYYAREPSEEHRWYLCAACLVTVAEERLDADGTERGWIGPSMDALRREAWEAMIQAASWTAALCHGEESWTFHRARKAYPCEVCFGTIEPGDRYGRFAAGGGKSWRDWAVCGNCSNSKHVAFVDLPRETWRKTREPGRGVVVFTEAGEEIPF